MTSMGELFDSLTERCKSSSSCCAGLAGFSCENARAAARSRQKIPRECYFDCADGAELAAFRALMLSAI